MMYILCVYHNVQRVVLIFILFFSLYFLLPRGASGWPMSLPRSLTPKARSILPKICWLGMARPDSYSPTI
jgi:hypothetical protein